MIVEAVAPAIKNYGVEVYYNFFEVLTRTIDMTLLIPPIVARLPVKNSAEWIDGKGGFGVSCVVIWLESGAQLHTWSEYSLVTLDIYSCKTYDPDVVKRLFDEWFSPEGYIKILCF
ncbi:MAG: S-adenosylmethionine decarboxylase [Nitrososphaerota archaeon]